MKRLRDLIRRWLGNGRTRRLLAGASLAAGTLVCGVASGSEADHIWSVFKAADQNNSAAIERGELASLLEALKEPVPEGDLDQVFATIDHDGNGAVEIEELLHWKERPNFWTWDNQKPPTGWFWLNFFVFIGILVYFTRQPVKEMFKKRHETIKKNLHDAQAIHEKALGHREEYRDKLARVEEEGKTLIAGAKADGAGARERIIVGSKAYADRLRADADSAVAQEESFARRRLRREVALDVLHDAKGILENEIGAEDQQRLLEQAIAEIENGSGELAEALEATGGAR